MGVHSTVAGVHSTVKGVHSTVRVYTVLCGCTQYCEGCTQYCEGVHSTVTRYWLFWTGSYWIFWTSSHWILCGTKMFHKFLFSSENELIWQKKRIVKTWNYTSKYDYFTVIYVKQFKFKYTRTSTYVQCTYVHCTVYHLSLECFLPERAKLRILILKLNFKITEKLIFHPLV